MSNSVELEMVVIAGLNGGQGEASARHGAGIRPAGNRR